MKIGRSSNIEHYFRLKLSRMALPIIHVNEALFVSFAMVFLEF